MSGDLTGLCLYMSPIYHMKQIISENGQFFQCYQTDRPLSGADINAVHCASIDIEPGKKKLFYLMASLCGKKTIVPGKNLTRQKQKCNFFSCLSEHNSVV